MRTLLLAFLLALSPLCHTATIPAANVALPQVDFPELQLKSGLVACVADVDDGRQVIVLQNGMAFVSMTDERLPAGTARGQLVGVFNVFPVSTDPDRRPYLFAIGEGRGRPQLVGYRIR